MLVVANPLLDKDGRYAGALGMITDITERKQAEEAAQRYTERLSLLRQIEQGILRAESPEAVATVVLDYLQKLAPLEYASIALMDYEAKEVHEIAVYKRGERTPGTRTPFAAVGSAMEKAEVTRRGEIFIMDTATYAKESPVIRGVFENGVRYIANVPLLAQGELIGALCLGASTGEGLPAEVLDLAQETAAPLAIAIQQARLFDAERQRSGELSRSNTLIASLARMAVRVQKSLDPQQVMETLGAELKSLEIDSVVALSEPQEFALSVRYVSFDRTVVELLERLTGEPMHGFRVPRERVPVYGELVRRKEPLYVRDVIPLAEASLSHLPSALIERTIELIGLVQGSSVILLPLTVEDRVLGFLAVVGKDLREDAVPAFSIFASQVAICLENARLFEELRVAQNSLGSLSRQLVEAHETERRTLARELHDEIGQLLTGLNLSLEACLRSDGDGIKARLSKGLALSSELLGRVRDLSLALRPAMLDDLGLVPTLLWHFEQFTGQTGVRVAFERSHLEGRLDPKIETAAYRIIQEALTNVARHAKVHEATVRLWADEQVMGMQIQDHGLGFDAQSVLSRCTTSGLIGMRERTTALGGHLVVESRPGTGTCVTAELPHDEGHQPIDEGEP
jgi:signal transduction histidine kinase